MQFDSMKTINTSFFTCVNSHETFGVEDDAIADNVVCMPIVNTHVRAAPQVRMRVVCCASATTDAECACV